MDLKQANILLLASATHATHTKPMKLCGNLSSLFADGNQNT